jgi:hypothetical protein
MAPSGIRRLPVPFYLPWVIMILCWLSKSYLDTPTNFDSLSVAYGVINLHGSALVLGSLLPITEAAPGVGGANIQKSSTELTIGLIQLKHDNEGEATRCTRFDTAKSGWRQSHTDWCPSGPAQTAVERYLGGK